jgi:uncharacterized protein YgbK (DUF1537 family)
MTTIVLDDDPTGTQAVHDVPVLLAWPDAAVSRAARGARALHLMTNVRALPPERAEAVTADAARAALRAVPGARLVLRGDSTLRGHLLEELRAVLAATGAARPPAVLLVPALPAAGRVTRDGIHWLVQDGRRTPLHETEYARDGGFAYESARLLAWAEERTAGLLRAADGVELELGALRAGGPDAVAEALRTAAARAPAACVPDAEELSDLELIAEGLRRAEAAGTPVLVRCAPTFAGVLAGTLADGLVPPPSGARGLLIACGSYVGGTTRQLAHLRAARGVVPVELDVLALASPQPEEEIERAATAARRALAEDGLALVATPRERPPETISLEAGARIASGLARVVAALGAPPGVVLAKGGITSQVTLQEGLGADEARVVGPVAAGVAHWAVRHAAGEVAYLVFPGNVGGPSHLTDVVDLVLGA